MTFDATVALDAMLDAGVHNEESEIECDIQHRLDTLTELQALQACMAENKRKALDSILTPEIRQQIADIELEYAPREEDVNARITEATANVKTAVIAYGKSVAGDHLQAVYMRGRESWDSRGLQGYAMAHPEVLTFQKIGEPSVSIRKR